MSTDLQAYLASRYMSGPKADAILASKDRHKKKRKKKNKTVLDAHGAHAHSGTPPSGLILRDDDGGDWKEETEDDDDGPVFEETSALNAKSFTASKWSSVKPADSANAREEIEPKEPEDEQPQIVHTGMNAPVQGGLQTSAQIKAHVQTKKAAEAVNTSLRGPQDAQEEETVYRDSQGRKIDTKQMRAEEKRRQAKALEKQMKKMEWGKGLVQRANKKAEADELAKIVAQPFARTIDDREMNDELKDKQRWNDPAAAFLTKTSEHCKSSRPKYNGPPPPPNRYGIAPGFRWDGVDRSNGFERKLFQRTNDQKRLRSEAYNYSVDEM